MPEHDKTQLASPRDRDKVAELPTRLGQILDERPFDDERLRAVYTEDVVAHSPGGTFEGLAAVRAHLRADMRDDQHTQHVNSDTMVDLDGDRAEVTVNQITFFFRPGEAPHRSAGLRCAYTAVRTPDGWKLARATLTPVWQQAA